MQSTFITRCRYRKSTSQLRRSWAFGALTGASLLAVLLMVLTPWTPLTQQSTSSSKWSLPEQGSAIILRVDQLLIRCEKARSHTLENCHIIDTSTAP